jgi:regulator of protease activity HflC (stomatin/prohibitin superfamily)
MLDVLRDLIGFLVQWIPRFVIIKEFEAGVKLVWGNYTCTLTSTNGVRHTGFHVWWPLATDVYTVDTKPQLERVACQSVMTSDNKAVGVSGAIEYSVHRPHLSVLAVQDVEESLLHLTTGTMTRYINPRTLEECRQIEPLEQEIVRGIRNRAGEWGLKIRRFYITDLVEHKAIRIMTGSEAGDGWVPVNLEDDE